MVSNEGKSDLILKDLGDIKLEVKTFSKEITDIKIKQAENTQILKEHIRRTEVSEERLQRLEDFKWYFAGLAVLIGAATQIINKVF